MGTNTIGQRIRHLRTKHKLSQRDLSDRLNISPTTLSMYETDNRVPSDDIKKKISDYFNVSLDYLMGKSETSNNKSDLSKEAKRDIGIALDSIRDELLSRKSGDSSATTLLHGKPVSEEGIDDILNALRIGMELVEMRIASEKK